MLLSGCVGVGTVTFCCPVPVEPVCLDEVSEWSIELRVGDFVDVDIEPLEEGLVEAAPDGVARAEIELPGVLEEVYGGVNVVQHGGELVFGSFLSLGEALAGGGDVVHSLPNGLFGHVPVGGEVEQVLLLDVEALQFLGQMGVQLAGCPLVVVDRSLDACADAFH
ncbi:hypothetical protein [Microbacterium lacticum]